ncbi:DUF2441 domain-containing protein [Clostridium fungisolvens]|uniref:DUF2441 domain-containing protein n=1 Tax=Clostridium fungisolvens TaxID=1604897 RepID=A0A6V8SDZ9_9CLOT|nr:DUF2441 domain-containing protein [Clostridium fungisolvens]GFP75447.1 hypothetical protein bsdtw1_01527 [Clostridium fungisolvens]
MEAIYFYHVVTEKPMKLGQKILFDENNHNGVYNRVMTFKRIVEGEDVHGEIADLIKSDLDKWGKVAYRELALEEVRREEYCNYPSRLACLYTSRTLEEAKKWAQFFKNAGREVYSIVKLKVQGNVFDGDACNCFDGTKNKEDNSEKARHYWGLDIENHNPVIETLVDGEITVDEIIEDFQVT